MQLWSDMLLLLAVLTKSQSSYFLLALQVKKVKIGLFRFHHQRQRQMWRQSFKIPSPMQKKSKRERFNKTAFARMCHTVKKLWIFSCYLIEGGHLMQERKFTVSSGTNRILTFAGRYFWFFVFFKNFWGKNFHFQKLFFRASLKP